MLPPVRATLNSSVDYPTPQHPPMLRQAPNISNAANHGANVAMPISGGRLDVLSLSAQLQLAQGFSIFAETIGKLANLPRREGEALLDYAKRLMETVKAMSVAEQAGLARMLNQLVKGMSLRLLMDILNKPNGPDAARLAVRLETAQLLERDLAAKAVVSSYRQNSGVETSNTIPLQGAPAKPAEAAAPVGAAATQRESVTELQGQNPAAGEEASAFAGEDAGQEATDTQPEPGPGSSDPNAEIVERPPTAQVSLLQAELTKAEVLESEQAQIGLAGTFESSVTEEALVAQLAESETAEVFAPVLDDLPEGHIGRAAADDQDVWGPASRLEGERRPTAGGVYDGPALARLSQRGMGDQSTHHAGNTGRTAMPAMSELLAEIFAEGNIDLLEPLAPLATALPEQQVLEELLDDGASLNKQAQAEDTGKAIPHPPGGSGSEEPEAPSPHNRPTNASAISNGQPPTFGDGAEQLVLPLPPVQIPRDGVAFPYIAYPPEERERDPEERQTKAIDPTDEDGEQQQGAGDEQFSQDRSKEGKPEEEKHEAAGEQAEEQAEDRGRAHDLYLRMAGWA